MVPAAVVWTAYFRRWLDHPAPDEVLAACIYFDVRPIAGAAEIAAPLEAIVRTEARERRVFLGLLARDVVTRRVPRTLLGNIGVVRRGPERGTVDVKAAGALQLTGAARVHALELGLASTNTIERFQAASARGLYVPGEAREITDAYQHLARLRLVHQLERLAAGAPPDNRVNPARLLARRRAALPRRACDRRARPGGPARALLHGPPGMRWLSSPWQRPRGGPDLAAITRRFVAVDLETTGLDARTDAIVALAAVPFVGRHPEPGLEMLVTPGA